MKSIPIINKANSHYYDNLSNDFKAHNGTYIIIPTELTMLLQPLVISIDYPLKRAL